MPNALTPLIRKLEAEATLSKQEKEAVLNLRMTVRDIRADHEVVRDRDRPSQCCLVLEGWLYRYKLLDDATRQIFSFHIARDMPDLRAFI